MQQSQQGDSSLLLNTKFDVRYTGDEILMAELNRGPQKRNNIFNCF